ncbi:hypothetical protein DV702_09115 [Sporosarcina sp. PTS2304]|uniref:DUF4097 family beta strand repeat-containing protein n=1 Tax=Sporosarcina sp. PTS2304 TaxID=2283194 RepID=UPI000E0D8C56|nr:DUF4097 family beta strand repeat-containing protein [Sporosarcina sp. PTS2304]AXH99881.1 hypothetical protein DV702_09115 [Sporosarcina sp. PTS2304]
MQNERVRILTLLEEGKITADEALKLLEAMGNESHATAEEEKPSADAFFEDIRKEFMTAGDRFMQFMDTAVHRVKEFDFEAPFSKSVAFTHVEKKSAEDIEDLLIDIDHGAVEIHPSDDGEITAMFTVKHFNNDSETEALSQFLDKLLFIKDGKKLRISSDLKMLQVNLKLYVPAAMYGKLSVRLLNGACSVEGIECNDLRIKTANGKIECSNIKFDEAEIQTANGMVRLLKVHGDKLETETLNGRVYVDGEVVAIEAKSLNGNVTLTTTSAKARCLEAKSISGAVELYFPSSLAVKGEISSNMGKLDLQLKDVSRVEEQEQFLHRTIRFGKTVENEEQAPIQIIGESKTGSVMVRYNSVEI